MWQQGDHCIRAIRSTFPEQLARGEPRLEAAVQRCDRRARLHREHTVRRGADKRRHGNTVDYFGAHIRVADALQTRAVRFLRTRGAGDGHAVSQCMPWNL